MRYKRHYNLTEKIPPPHPFPRRSKETGAGVGGGRGAPPPPSLQWVKKRGPGKDLSAAMRTFVAVLVCSTTAVLSKPQQGRQDPGDDA